MADDFDLSITIAIAAAKAKVAKGMSEKERIDAIKSGEYKPTPPPGQAEIDQRQMDQIVLDSTPGASVVKMAQGIPFAGEYLDEAMGAAFGDRAKEKTRAIEDAMQRQHPIGSAVAQFAGGVIGSLPAAALAGPLAGLAPEGIGARVGMGAGIGLAAGASEGAVSGYGAGTDQASRMGEAGTRALIGGGAGAVVGAAAPLVAKGAEVLIGRLKGKDVGIISKTLGISPAAARVIKRHVESDDPTAIVAEMRRAGKDAMLADGGAGLTQLLDTAMSEGGPALRVGIQAVETRAKMGERRLVNLMDGILGKPVGVKTAQKEISGRTAAAREMAYGRAYDTPIDYGDGGAGNAILDVLDRVPDKTFKAAIDEANQAMQAAGVKNRQILASVADDGTVTLSEMPNVQQVDEIKKALRDIAARETDDRTGKITAAGLRAKKLAGELSDALGDAVPMYKTATKLGGDKLQMEDAAALGRKLFKDGTSREEVAQLVGQGLSREAKTELKRAMRSQIEDVMANAKRTIGGGSDTEIQEAMKAVKLISSRAARDKAEMVLGKQASRVLFDQLDEMGKLLETRLAVQRGSQTAIRLAGREAVADITKPGAAGKLARGEPVMASKDVVQFLTGRTPEFDTQRRRAIFEEIARALTEARGPDAMKSLDIVQKAIAGQSIKDADAALVARTISSVGALTGYQAESQMLPPAARGQ